MITYSEDGRRRCGGCDRFLPPSEFGRSQRLEDGLAFYCKQCESAANRRAKRRRAEREGRTYIPRPHRPRPARGHRWCPGCEQELLIEQFVKNRTAPGGIGYYCNPCQEIRRQQSRERLHDGSVRNYHLKRRYGITEADFDRLFAQQRGVCAICHTDPAAHVDHDHETGAVRGLLCFTCNVGLGNFKDDLVRILNAADYLEGYMHFGGTHGTGAA